MSDQNTTEKIDEKPMLSVIQLSFSDGTNVSLSGNELVVFVGPNDAGKSAALAGINAAFRDKGNNPVILDLEMQRTGTAQEVFSYLKQLGQETGQGSIQISEGRTSYGTNLNELERVWAGELKKNHMDRFLVQYLGVRDRFILAQSRESFRP